MKYIYLQSHQLNYKQVINLMASPPFPSPPTHNTVDTYDARRGQTIPCSQCGNGCTNLTHSLSNWNPTYPEGSNVTYCIPFCSSQCKKKFIQRCRDSAPFPIGPDEIFTFHEKTDDPKLQGCWRMFSIIPEDGGWIVFKCDDEGNTRLPSDGDMIWELVPHALLQKAVRVYN